MTPWTSVVSYHLDPEACGVARFSAQLAQRLGVPHVGFWNSDNTWGHNPLLSLKWQELKEDDPALDLLRRRGWAHDQLWHDEPWVTLPHQRVWKLYELGVPSLVEPVAMAPQALFTFGMAHKIDLAKFVELREKFPLDQLWISTAAHEGAGPSRVQELELAWGNARNLGHLSDAALRLVWPHCLAFVAFFEHGLRANNSSVHAALDAGVPVITNHGAQTPSDLVALTFDYREPWPRTLSHARHSPYTWDRLLKELGCEPSRS